VLLAALAVVAAALVAVADASACSCVVLDLDRDLPAADAAFVGHVVSREADKPIVSTADPVRWTFEVETAVKGELPQRVVVLAAVDSASCGLGLEEGQRAGLLLDRERDEWTSSLCRQADPAELIRNVQPGARVVADAEEDGGWWPYAAAGALGLAAAIAFALRRSAG
jgi:hypothetical protein